MSAGIKDQIMLQEEYYVIKRENNNNYPLFAWAQSAREYNMGKPVEYTEPVNLLCKSPSSVTLSGPTIIHYLVP